MGAAMLPEAPPYSGDPAVGEGLAVRGPDDEMRAGGNPDAECYWQSASLCVTPRSRFSEVSVLEDRMWRCFSQSLQPAAGKPVIADYRRLQRAGIMRESGGRKRKCPVGQMP